MCFFRRLRRTLTLILERIDNMPNNADVKAQTDRLLEAIRKNTDATDSVKTLINGLRSQIDDLRTQVANGASSADITAALDSAISQIDADTLAEATLANTDLDPTDDVNNDALGVADPAPAAPLAEPKATGKSK